MGLSTSLGTATEVDDVETFVSVFEENLALVVGIARRIIPDRSAAEDVAQAVFLKLWNGRRAIVRDNVKGWLSRVARNEAIDVMRRGRRQWQIGLYSEILDCDEAIMEVSRIFEVHWTRLVVTSALERLSVEQREAIELGFFTGLTHEEIARALRLPLGTVKSRIRAGLQRLRELLGEGV